MSKGIKGSIAARIGVVVVLAVSPLFAEAEGFGCSKAADGIDKSICTDATLAALDTQLSADLKALLSMEPHERDRLVGDEHEWIRERDEQCGSEAEGKDQNNCLTAAYLGRLAQLEREGPAPSAPKRSPSSCQKIIERYRPLANGHPGEAPLSVLSGTPASGFKLAEHTGTEITTTTDLSAWSTRQTPPFVVTEVLLSALREFEDTGSGDLGTLTRIPGTDIYSFTQFNGSQGCPDSRSFRVMRGFAFPWPTQAPAGDGGWCGLSAKYATLDGTPLAIVQDYDWRPGMTASLSVSRWTGAEFSQECQVSLTYKPHLAKETFNHWDESCEGVACESLRRAAFKIAAAAEADAEALKANSADPLMPSQKEAFKSMAEIFQTQRREPESDDAFSIPLLTDGHLYLASIGHQTIGWREYADYSVIFDELDNGQLVRRGSFAVGTWKGDLEKIVEN